LEFAFPDVKIKDWRGVTGVRCLDFIPELMIKGFHYPAVHIKEALETYKINILTEPYNCLPRKIALLSDKLYSSKLQNGDR
jgi:hypothetical protein